MFYNTCKDEQVLQVAVVREHGAVQDYLLQQLDELVGQICRHEGLHRHRDVFGVLGLRQGGLDNLGIGKNNTINTNDLKNALLVAHQMRAALIAV